MQSIIPTLKSGLVSWLTPDSWNMVEVLLFPTLSLREAFWASVLFLWNLAQSQEQIRASLLENVEQRHVILARPASPQLICRLITRPWGFKSEELPSLAQPKLMAIQNGVQSQYWGICSLCKCGNCLTLRVKIQDIEKAENWLIAAKNLRK